MVCEGLWGSVRVSNDQPHSDPPHCGLSAAGSPCTCPSETGSPGDRLVFPLAVLLAVSFVVKPGLSTEWRGAGMAAAVIMSPFDTWTCGLEDRGQGS